MNDDVLSLEPYSWVDETGKEWVSDDEYYESLNDD